MLFQDASQQFGGSQMKYWKMVSDISQQYTSNTCVHVDSICENIVYYCG